MQTRATRVVCLALLASCAAMARADSFGGAVFTMTDDVKSNEVMAYARDPIGRLKLAGTYPTGGAGSGGGEAVLGSQGSVTLSRNGRFLLVVNAGSDEVSSFRVDGSHLTWESTVPSGGMLPVSVAEHDGIVYVLNAGGTGNISGFKVDGGGRLNPLVGSTRPMSSGASGPAEVSFDPSGEFLAVSEKAANTLRLYEVREDGLLSGPMAVRSSGANPFGFAFTHRDILVVAEAAGGPSGTSAVSTYDVDLHGTELVSGSVPDNQRAACWLVTTHDEQLAFVANAASATISTYTIDRKGTLLLAAGAAGILPSGGKPLDEALAEGDRLLYALDAGNHGIVAFQSEGDGTLTPIGEVASGLPASAVGLAAR